jgi:hypothetical protein
MVGSSEDRGEALAKPLSEQRSDFSHAITFTCNLACNNDKINDISTSLLTCTHAPQISFGLTQAIIRSRL